MKALSHAQFMALYDEQADSIFRLCFFKTSDRDIALDLMQDSFVKVWDYLQAGNEVENLKAFTYTVARNLIKDFYKKKKSYTAGSYDDIEIIAQYNDDLTHSSTSQLAEVEQVLSLLDRLSKEDAQLLRMRLLDELSPQEIAVLLGEKENTISVRIHRALKRYREVLEGTV